MIKEVSIIGLGKLGASMAAAFASRGLEVTGVDVNKESVRLINEGKAPVQETDLEEYISKYADKIRATHSFEEAVLNSDISFVIVPTPSDENGSFSLQYAARAFEEIGKALAKKSSYHNVVLTSTVLPGATRYGLIPILERESGKKAGMNFGVCYSPEFIALGSIIRDFLNPDFTLLGELDKKSGDQLEEIYSNVIQNKAPCKRMSLENAELTKISINTFVTTKITFANMLADLCEKLPGGDIDVVTDALGTDERIGKNYLTGSIGYGGPCFPRDNVALSYLAKILETRTELAETTDLFNRNMSEKIYNKLRSTIKPDDTVAILGLAYKPLSHVTEESPGVYLAEELSKAGIRVVAFDPLANDNAKEVFEGKVEVLDSIADCLSQAQVVLITNPDDEFKKLTIKDFKNKFENVTIVDFWRILQNELSCEKRINYIGIGTSFDDSGNEIVLKKLWGKADSAVA